MPPLCNSNLPSFDAPSPQLVEKGKMPRNPRGLLADKHGLLPGSVTSRGDWIRTSDLMLPNPERRVLVDHTIPCKTRGILNRNNHIAASSCSGFVTSDHAISDLVVNIWSTRHSKPACCAPRQQSAEPPRAPPSH